MSCGLTTTSASVSALRGGLDVGHARRRRTAPGARLPAPAASRRPARPSARRPARSSPDSRVSPITPAPMIATVSLAPPSWRQRREEERQVARALGQPAHEVAVPLLAVRHVDPHLLALVGQPALLVGPDAVQHLVLVAALRPIVRVAGPRDLDQPRVVGGDHRVALAGHQHLEAPHVGPVDVVAVRNATRLGLVVGALAQPHPRPLDGQVSAVALGPVQVGLERRRRSRGSPCAGPWRRIASVASVVAWSSMSRVTVVPA